MLIQVGDTAQKTKIPLSPIITKLTGLADIGLIECIACLREHKLIKS